MEQELEEILEKLSELKKEKEQLEKQEKELKARAKELLESMGISSYSGERGRIYIVERKSISVDKKLLQKKWPEVFEAVKRERVSRYVMYSFK